MKFLLKFSFLNLCLILGLTTSMIYADDREGTAAGVFFTSVNATNPWVGASNGNSNFKETEGSATRWSLPIHFGMYGDDVHIDFATDFAGWFILSTLGDKNNSPGTPAFTENDNYAFLDMNLASIRVAADFFEMSLPILIGGQGGLGYMGIDASDKTSNPYFEKGSYASYGANIGTNFELGDQFVSALFMYDWVSMGDNKKGNRWGIEVEYFPFSHKSALNFVRIKAFTKSTQMNYPKKIDETDYKYSDFQIGVGLIFNILI